jgi:putative endonuclease
MQGTYYVYILASQRNGALYVGVTNDVVRRVSEHRQDLTPGFTTKYGVKRLVWYEAHRDINVAIAREKRIKRWKRAWKVALIEAENPQWLDLWERFFEPLEPGPLSHLNRS